MKDRIGMDKSEKQITFYSTFYNGRLEKFHQINFFTFFYCNLKGILK